jgi:hypothetical protein
MALPPWRNRNTNASRARLTCRTFARNSTISDMRMQHRTFRVKLKPPVSGLVDFPPSSRSALRGSA